MHRLLAILLVVAMAFAFVGCDAKDDTSPKEDSSGFNNTTTENNDINDGAVIPEDSGVSNEDWTTAIQSQKFENVTFAYNATFISGYDDVGPHGGTYKLTNDGMMYDNSLITEEESINAARTLFIDTVIAIVSNFDAFEYDQENDCYTASEAIVYESMFFGGWVTITSDNTVVVLDEACNIAKLSCQMTQDFKQVDGTPVTYVLDVEITFSDYGTTVLE